MAAIAEVASAGFIEVNLAVPDLHEAGHSTTLRTWRGSR
ncbi:hypothetical protein PAMC26577_39830 [Caballeronia sordidicola]|uniref:Uncharacterized protein n=1 Tax=Caballeronia sordidicola TaxID=196367 RepID=A0A242M4D2_CABSO|nr:hypothetical protein PAMC26577_39830 [Caballeronia sordidicola]